MINRIGHYFRPGLVSRGQRGWHRALVLLLTLLLANTLFLLARRYSFGCALDAYDACRVSVFYQASVLLHSLLGIVLTLVAIGFVISHVPRNLAQAARRIGLPVTGVAVVLTLGVLLWSGIHFLFNAKTADMAWLYNLHLAISAVIVIAYFGHRALARPKHASSTSTGGIVTISALTALLVVVELMVAPGPVDTPASAIAALDSDGFRPIAAVNPTAPFFPSPVTLASGAAEVSAAMLLGGSVSDPERIRGEVAEQGFADDVPIGAETCVRCHADTVAQWASSAHRFSSFNNPFYVATLRYLRDAPVEPNHFIDAHLSEFGLLTDATGRVKSRFCAGCHDPLLLLTGKMTGDIDEGSVEAQAGLTCLSCHLIDRIPNHTGNGNYVWNDRYSDSYLLSGARSGVAMTLHDMYLKANPERHIADLTRPFYKTPEFCATCHKVSLDRPVNDYRWLRGQDEYDAWHNSGVAHNAARTFYLPPVVRVCHDCHMPLEEALLGDVAAENGKVRSHRFLAANTALPFLRGDKEMLEATERRLKSDILRLFVGGVAGETDEPIPLADDALTSIPDDEHIELHVVVRNLDVGHTFPGGTNDSNEAWIEVTAGSYRAGTLGDDQHVAGNTRIYNVVAVDRDGNRIDKRNAHEMVAPVYVAVIPPGTADLSRYSIPLAKLGDLSQGLDVRVRLLWRKFNRTYSENSYALNPQGFAGFDGPPELPVTEIASAILTLKRTAAGLTARVREPPAAPAALLLDYAIGFLRQGDLRAARLVIGEALAVDPECLNCRRTSARIQLGEGQFANARKTLGEAEKLTPGDPQTAWLWAQLLVEEGKYGAADQALARVLSAFPADRMAHKLKARVAYLDGRFDDSLAAVDAGLAIDPEDSTGHYYAMLAHRALSNTEAEREAEAAYRYYKTDETAQQATLAFRRRAEDANLAAQRIKVFTLQ